MSTRETRRVIRKAVTDEKFRTQLFRDPKAALNVFDLTDLERIALKGLPAEQLEIFAGRVDERISMSMLAFAASAYGGEVLGGEMMVGDTGTEVGKLPTWLIRLMEALDLHLNSGSEPSGINFY